MKQIAQCSSAAHNADKENFKGYDLNQLRYRLMVNDLKIQFAKSQLATEMAAERRREETNIAGMWLNLETWITYGQIALFSYRSVKKILSIFHGFKKKR